MSSRSSASFPVPWDLIKRQLAACAGIILLLEIWRPHFFLTDDNLTAGLGFLTEVGRHLKSGRSPFFSDYLFGGHYDFLRDPTYFVWHPLYLLCSLLADTPLRLWMFDCMIIPSFLLAGAGFAYLAAFLRDELRLTLSDGRIMLYTLSFTFSTFALTTAASWSTYAVSQSVLPWLALGLLVKEGRRSLALITLFALHQILGGHLAATISNEIFLGLFAVAVAIYRRSARPVVFWIVGHLAAVLICLPILLPAFSGFAHSARGAGMTAARLNECAVPLILFPISFLVGNYSELFVFFAGGSYYHELEFPKIPILLACAASWCVIPALFSAARWRFLEAVFLGFAVVLFIFIVRPLAITQAMTHVPLLRSMRWPFREILQFQFFIHLFLVVRPQRGKPAMQNLVAASSVFSFLLPLPFIHAPTFNSMTFDRELLASGRADRYWDRVRFHLQPGDQIATIVDEKLYQSDLHGLPFTLAGTGNLPAYFRIPSISGYSTTPPQDQLAVDLPRSYWFGAFQPAQRAELLREKPHLKIITVESYSPLKITLSSDDLAPIDLTPDLDQSHEAP